MKKFVEDAECIAEFVGMLWKIQKNKQDVNGFKENMSVLFKVASESQPSCLKRTPPAVAALIQYVPMDMLDHLLQTQQSAQLASVLVSDLITDVCIVITSLNDFISESEPVQLSPQICVFLLTVSPCLSEWLIVAAIFIIISR